jgi:membrane protease YdiL (CAAX protease family)
MIVIIFLCLLAPISVFIGSIICRNVLLTIILFHGCVCLLIPTIDLVIIEKTPLNKLVGILGFSNIKVSLYVGLIWGMILFTMICLFFLILHDSIIDSKRIYTLLSSWTFTIENTIFFSIYMVVGNSLLEEFFWRGYLYHKLLKIRGVTFTILLTALFYSSYHVIITMKLYSFLISILFTIVVFAVGTIWGYLRYRLNSVYVTIISHFLADLGLIFTHHVFVLREAFT